MYKQGLQYCSILVVDTHASSRTLLAGTLNDIGVGIVNSVPNGAAAIDHLRLAADINVRSVPPVDMVITEWEMEPVGGMMLLNWIRHHKDSPDRFLRTVIMSGEMDAERVERARNAGANAVFAKPFTINGIYKHMTSVLFSNPPYFKTETYFGPDRRRHKSEFVIEERRKIEKPYAERLNTGLHAHIGCFDLPHYISEVAVGRPRDQINYGERYQAHHLLSAYAQDYADWIVGDVQVLRLAFQMADENPNMRARNMSLMEALITRLVKEGDLFGYPLITSFAYTLHNTIKTDVRLWDQTAEIFVAALNGLDTVVRLDVRGDGGEVGVKLNESLRKLNTKLVRFRPQNAHRKGISQLA